MNFQTIYKHVRIYEIFEIFWTHSAWLFNETQQTTQCYAWIAFAINYSAPTIL